MRVWAFVAASLVWVSGLGSLCALGGHGTIASAAGLGGESGIEAQAAVAMDVDGHSVHLFPAADVRVVVLVFVATDCPISNRYLPELVRLRNAVAANHVTFWFVYPNLTETAAAIRAHQATYGARGDVLRDDNQALARLTGAKVTPEAAVLVRHGSALRVVYTGRIDDRYLSIGNERPQATRHELAEAIGAAVAAQPVSAPVGPPVGCGIVGTR